MFPADLNPGVRNIRSHTGLRGVAALTVVFIHLRMTFGSDWGLSIPLLDGWSWGWPAVDLFFVLSGYILYHVYVGSGRLLDWGTYLVARVARITPLYYLTLLAVPVGGTFYLMQLLQLPRDVTFYGWQHAGIVLANLFMVAGLIDGGLYPANGPSWSISVEMLLYVTMFPLLVTVVPKLGKRLLWLLAVFFTLLMFVSYTELLPSRIGAWSWVYVGRGVGGFSAGFLMCHLAHTKQLPSFLAGNPVRRLFLYAVVPAVFALQFSGAINGGASTLLFPLIVLYTASDQGLFAGIFKAGMLQWLGDRSYSIYLWHYPIFCYWEKWVRNWPTDTVLMDTFRSGILVVVVLFVSSLSYQYFEIPAQRMIRKWGRPRRPVEVPA